MAHVTGSINVYVSKDYYSRKFPYSISANITADPVLAVSGPQSIGNAAHEALALGDVTTCGWAFFQNLDDTNYVQIGTDTTGTFRQFLELAPGESVWVKLCTNAPYAKANTAAVVLDYTIFQR